MHSCFSGWFYVGVIVLLKELRYWEFHRYKVLGRPISP